MTTKRDILNIITTLELERIDHEKITAVLEASPDDILSEMTLEVIRQILLDAEEKVLNTLSAQLEIDGADDQEMVALGRDYGDKITGIMTKYQEDMEGLADQIEKLEEAENMLIDAEYGVDDVNPSGKSKKKPQMQNVA